MLPFFVAHGFHEIPVSLLHATSRGSRSRPVVAYRRQDLSGYDAITVIAEKHRLFGVKLLRVPQSIEQWVQRGLLAHNLSPHHTPYLSSETMRTLPRWWPSRTASEFTESLSAVLPAYNAVGEPWLRALRDPLRYAREAEQMFAFIAALAWDAAGDPATAAKYYEEMVSRYEWIYRDHETIAELPSFWEELLYVADRVGWESPVVKWIRQRSVARSTA